VLVYDLILAVKDPLKFHEENIKMNPWHYSVFAKRLPLAITNFVNNSGPQVYYNALIPIKSMRGDEFKDEDRRMKYGVVSEEALIRDLTEWDSFFMAGRLQKPVYSILDNPSVENALEKNRRQALCLGIFMVGEKLFFTRTELYEAITSISYVGDIRMKLKMEHKYKIANIVNANYEHFQRIYEPFIHELISRGYIYPPDEK